jgi:hypothetical protein
VNAVSTVLRMRAAQTSTPRASVVLTAAFAVFSIGATVIVVAAFIALLVGGGRGAHAPFALVAGSLAFAALALVQFIRWAATLLRELRGGQ